MRAFISHTLDGVDSLAIQTVAAPGPIGPGQIRVAMRAASINYRDLLVLSGALRSVTVPDLVPCSDGAGEVVEVGSQVWRVKVGDRVALTFNPDWLGGPWQPSRGGAGRGGAVQGVMQDELVVDQQEAVILPAHLSFEEGATLPCAAVTAWHSLCAATPLLPGMTVLLQGGGGVSLFALRRSNRGFLSQTRLSIVLPLRRPSARASIFTPPAGPLPRTIARARPSQVCAVGD